LGDTGPFIKWVGGKTQLLPILREKFSKGKTKYCEPFIGGGAVFFDIVNTIDFEEILINDLNKQLITTYVTVRDDLNELIKKLEVFQKEYSNIEERADYFSNKRERYNYLIEHDIFDVEVASLFIFLNKTCFNGLYRTNLKGFFNVPIGAYKNPLICDCERLKKSSDVLKNVIITHGSYESCADFIDGNTFVYIDPPYRPLNATSSFMSYTKNSFNDEEQKKLALFVKTIHGRGADFILSNSDPKNINTEDCFFDDLYSEFNIERVVARRSINSKASKRGEIKELLISNSGNLKK